MKARDIPEREEKEPASGTAEERYANIIEFLPDATFVIDQEKRIIAWNRACEILTGVEKSELLGQGDYAYAVPFFGERRPILIDFLDQPSPEFEQDPAYKSIQRNGDIIFAESYLSRLKNGQGAHLWGVASPLFDQEGHRCGAVEVIRDVTDYKRVEQALRESELKYRTLFETFDEAILLMRHDRFIDCNSRALILFDCDRERIVGAAFSAFSPPAQKDGHSSEAKALEKISLAMSEGSQFFEWEYLRRNGATLMAEVSLNRLELNGEMLLQAIARDITERKRVEEERRESERKYRELVEYANNIILRWTRDGRITFLNEFGQRFYGYTEAEICGRHVVGTIVPESETSGRNLTTLINEICANPKAFEQNVNENIRRDGERVWIAWTNKTVLDESGEVIEILSVGTDITERKRAEEAIREINASLESRVAERTEELAVARDRAEESDRLKSAFLATMSHELRTPLNSIIGFTGILLQELAGPLNEEQTKQLRMIQDSGRHLLALINDVLDISKIEAGQIEIRCEPFSVRDVIQRITQNMAPLAEKKALRLIIHVSPEMGMLTSDRRRVEQILLNLLGNAVKFTERGEVSLTCELERDHVIFRVSDTGIGIRTEKMDKLFKPFHQIDTGLTRQHEGTGLGLAICKRLAERLGGAIRVESRWGQGSSFIVTLPVNSEMKP